MTPKYRLLDNINWDAIDGTNVKVEVSANYLILKPLKAGESLIILAQAVKPRAAKSNGQPTELLPSETPPDELAEIVAAERAWDQAQAEDKR